MPLYEYECTKCGHRFEKIQKFSDKLIRTCPECGGRVEQVLTAPAVQFKGSGWYVTDYASKSGGAAAEGSKDSKKEDKSKSETAESSSKESAKEPIKSGSSKKDKHK